MTITKTATNPVFLGNAIHALVDGEPTKLSRVIKVTHSLNIITLNSAYRPVFTEDKARIFFFEQVEERRLTVDHAYAIAKRESLDMTHVHECQYADSSAPIAECPCKCYTHWWFAKALDLSTVITQVKQGD